MSEYRISEIKNTDRTMMQQVEQLLEENGLKLDQHLDYTCAILNDEYELLATGSCFKDTLRDIAVSEKYRSEGLLNTLLSHLIEYQYARGNRHIFLYTKPDSSRYFAWLGFHEIARSEAAVFMENSSDGFERYLKKLEEETGEITESQAIVLHGNPFTLGHLHLIKTAAESGKPVHVFMVSEEFSPIPYEVRRKLIVEGCAGIENLIFHDAGDYIISHATFPAYFLKSQDDAIISQAVIDTSVFTRIAQKLAITRRWLGKEEHSRVTSLYNEAIKQQLSDKGIEVCEIERLKSDGEDISASSVRKLLSKERFEQLKKLVPQSTFDFFVSSQGKEIIESIRNSETEHY